MAGVENGDVEPVAVVIDGALHRPERLLIRAAATRSDVTIAGVVADLDGAAQEQFAHQLEHDSVCGRAPGLASGIPIVSSPQELEHQPAQENAVVVTSASTAQEYARRYGVPSQYDGYVLGRTIVTNTTRWNPTNRIFNRPQLVIPGLGARFYSAYVPCYVPDARIHATFPLLAGLSRDFGGLRHANVVELRSYDESGALGDKALGTNASLAQSRSVLLGSIEHDRSHDWVSFPLPTPEDQAVREVLHERSRVIPLAVGSRAVVFASLGQTARMDDVLESLQRSAVPASIEMEDEVTSSADARQQAGGGAGIISRHLVSVDKHLVGFDVLYDSDWSRAHRILDAAVAAHHRSTI